MAVEPRAFRVLGCLGQGSYGEVYLAEMTGVGGLRTEVALKLLRADLARPDRALRRLRDEARLLARLRHPAIPRVIDLTRIDGRVALISEYIEGSDLRVAMKQDAPGPRAMTAIAASVAGALAAAVQAKDAEGRELTITHRDVKLSNILVGRHGQVKLLDFGIAWSTDIDREATTASGVLVGSRPYLAPERFHQMLVNPEGDLFSLGCVLHVGWMGTHFYPGRALTDIAAVVTSRDRFEALLAERVAAVHQRLGLDAAHVLRRLLAWDPLDRLAAREVEPALEALDERMGGERLEAWARRRDWSEGLDLAHRWVGKVLHEQAPEPMDAVDDAPAPRVQAAANKTIEPATSSTQAKLHGVETLRYVGLPPSVHAMPREEDTLGEPPAPMRPPPRREEDTLREEELPGQRRTPDAEVSTELRPPAARVPRRASESGARVSAKSPSAPTPPPMSLSVRVALALAGAAVVMAVGSVAAATGAAIMTWYLGS